ncbi:MAG: 2Fe-2S iron-sulfur cluster binding domain-containing protein [SAR324 cluster bacterium]|nr:2Fe-2S iron-sulfur cluster binding domain-containing protein [SAR324 cluster bacterium]
MLHQIHLTHKKIQYPCSEETNLLKAMSQSGKAGIPRGCAEGGCGICKIKIEAGEFRTGKMSRSKVSLEEEKAGILLACRVFPLSDLKVSILEHNKPEQPF